MLVIYVYGGQFVNSETSWSRHDYWQKEFGGRKIHFKGDTYILAPRQMRVIICHDLGKELSLSIKGEEKKSQQNVKTYF